MSDLDGKYPMLQRLSAMLLIHGEEAVKKEFDAMGLEAQQQVRDEIKQFKVEVLSRILEGAALIDTIRKAKFN